ncbi:hypothetical protein [Mycolicibacterium bacteremicum]|uniref:hypothetical protein n=1 Tax=Mycolicibacterium bacteremicum TaxID=564198 RepID=UPI0026EDBF0F|nr:hypothetical protein [Mycolicibacterium bacteremicum]
MIAAVAATAVCAVAASGCSGGSDAPAEPTAGPELVVRHDVEGLTATIPAIGIPESVAWVQDGDASGARWTDAVVRMNPVVVEALVAQFDPVAGGRAPRVDEALAAEVPAGPFLSGELLDAGFSTEMTSTYAFLDRAHSTLVLQATSLD